jgi:hypothetical protein
MLAAMLLAADLAGSFSVSDRTELRGRAPGTAPLAASLDAETALTARLSLASRRFRAGFAYTPRLTLWDIGSRVFAPTQLQGGEARLEWLGRHARLSLGETASYGSVSLASSSLLSGPEGQPPHVDAIPTQVLQFASSTTTLASRLTFPRWTVDTSLGYQLAGGADMAARALMPLQTGPFGDATIDYAATRREHSLTRLSVVEAAFSSGTESMLVEADESWRHVWSRLVETRLSLGVSEGRDRAAPRAVVQFATYPVVEAVFERRAAGGHVDVLVSGRLGPTINRLFGTVEERVQGTIAASHHHRRFTTRALTSAAWSLTASRAEETRLFAGELALAYEATTAVAYDAGVRGFWQSLATNGAPFLQGTMFVGVSLGAPPVRW